MLAVTSLEVEGVPLEILRGTPGLHPRVAHDILLPRPKQQPRLYGEMKGNANKGKGKGKHQLEEDDDELPLTP